MSEDDVRATVLAPMLVVPACLMSIRPPVPQPRWPIIHPDATTRRRAAKHAGTKAPQG